MIQYLIRYLISVIIKDFSSLFLLPPFIPIPVTLVPRVYYIIPIHNFRDQIYKDV